LDLGPGCKKNNNYVKRIPPRSDELAVLSDFLQDEFEKNHGIRPGHVVPPGINSKQFGKEILKKDIDIVAAGSLIPLKQYDIFIEAIAEVRKQVPGLTAMLIGEGPEKSKLQSLIAKHELESNIILTGELSHADTLKMMQRTKIFLHPSSYEGFGIVCLEALCAGAHVISFVKPMHTEIINWHIASGQQDMIQKSIEILKNPGILYKSIIAYRIEESVQRMLRLFRT
jgi:glycosyltransferase involved in cell wall biosynthesis